LRASLEKAKDDLRILNTSIAFEKMKLAALKKAQTGAGDSPPPIDLGEIDAPSK
jgi:hypothetical protein